MHASKSYFLIKDTARKTFWPCLIQCYRVPCHSRGWFERLEIDGGIRVGGFVVPSLSKVTADPVSAVLAPATLPFGIPVTYHATKHDSTQVLSGPLVADSQDDPISPLPQSGSVRTIGPIRATLAYRFQRRRPENRASPCVAASERRTDAYVGRQERGGGD